ncbi:MAG: hypothetical protein ABSD41_02565 [Candidatus Bathyarchaeia archaeon]|jgi:hypothetical protein
MSKEIEDEFDQVIEKRVKARKRKRGPYRQSAQCHSNITYVILNTYRQILSHNSTIHVVRTC